MLKQEFNNFTDMKYIYGALQKYELFLFTYNICL